MVSHCACPTRVFRDRALREHRRPSSPPSLRPSEAACSDLPFIVLVAANPEPCDRVPLHNPECTIAERDADRPHMFFLVDALEVERRMNGGLLPMKERLARGLANVIGKAIVRFP